MDLKMAGAKPAEATIQLQPAPRQDRRHGGRDSVYELSVFIDSRCAAA
jgi:hypothetical protein